MECTPSVAGAASEAALANASSPAKVLLDPLLLLRLLLPALLLQLALPLFFGLLLGEEDVGDRYVDLRDPQAHQVLHPVDHVAPHRLGELGDGLAVLGRQRQVEGGLFLPDLDRDALGLAAAGYGTEDAAHGLRGAAAHPDAVDLLGRDPSDLGDHAVRYGGIAALGLERAALFAHASSPFVGEPLRIVFYTARRVISRYIASSMIAPRVAVKMDPRLKLPAPPEKPRRLSTQPPMRAPTIPIRLVTIMPPGSGPGMTHFARMPAISPTTIQTMMA